MPMWELSNIKPEVIQEFHEMPLYKYINERLTGELVNDKAMDEWFNQRLDPDLIAIMSAEICPTEDSAIGFVTGVVVGIMISEYRTGANNDETK